MIPHRVQPVYILLHKGYISLHEVIFHFMKIIYQIMKKIVWFMKFSGHFCAHWGNTTCVAQALRTLVLLEKTFFKSLKWFFPEKASLAHQYPKTMLCKKHCILLELMSSLNRGVRTRQHEQI